MTKRMSKSFKEGKWDFDNNKKILEKLAGCRAEFVSTYGSGAILTKPNNETMELKAEEGKFVSLLLLCFISTIYGDEFTMEGGAYDFMRSFFAPLWGDPIGKHPSIDFLREPGVRVKIIK